MQRRERSNFMSAPGNRSWDEIVDRLRTAASDVRSAIGRAGSPSADDDAATARLKGDISRLEQSASELIIKISAELRERRSEIDTSFDRERAQRTADQMKASLEELAALTGKVTADITSAANSTLKQSEPELNNVARALEDVAGSAASWIRSAIDPANEQPGKLSSQNHPPLDDL
jgi:predicted Zn-dependent peptidase